MLFERGVTGFLNSYATGRIYVNKSVLAEAGSLSITRTNNSKPIVTLHRGYAGERKGAGTVEVQVTSSIPSLGIEFDAGQFMGANQKVEFDLWLGESQMSFRGSILQDNFQSAINSNSTLQFSARGRLSYAAAEGSWYK